MTNYQSIEDELRFMLQTASKSGVGNLTESQGKLLRDLQESAIRPDNASFASPANRELLDVVSRVISDLGLKKTQGDPGTVLEAVNQYIQPRPVLDVSCRIDSSSCDKYVIWFQSADRNVDPVVMSTPTTDNGKEDAYVYTDAHIFGGFSVPHMRILKDLGIRRVQVLSFDGTHYDSLTNGFVPIEGQRTFATTTTETEIDTTYGSIFILVVVFFAMIVMGHKVLR